MKTCIACAEEIQNAAKLCRFCGTKQNDSAFIEDSDSLLLEDSEAQENSSSERVPFEPADALTIQPKGKRSCGQIFGLALVAFFTLGTGILFVGTILLGDGNGRFGSSDTPSGDALDKACSAMRAADLTLATVGKRYFDGRAVSQAQLDSLKTAEQNINNTYQATSGDFYSYMVGQANNLYLVRINLATRDFAVAETAINAYLDNDRYTQFCN